jgi:hypothetical protein
VRTVGDLLITFDFTNGGTTVDLGMRQWNGSAWGAAQALGSSLASGSVNSVPVLDPVTGQTLPIGTFGEAMIDLTMLFAGKIAPGECVHFSSAYLKSRSSASFTSETKDFIAPMQTELNVYEPPTTTITGASLMASRTVVTTAKKSAKQLARESKVRISSVFNTKKRITDAVLKTSRGPDLLMSRFY